ncbi:MAG: Ig-like domain-containing protein [Planctomycetota bacterium]|nr:Ig-like domain-containing protein [Planctomycetota bacterium]
MSSIQLIATCLALLLLSVRPGLAQQLAAADGKAQASATAFPLIGPGVPKMTFKKEELFKNVGVINSKLGIIHGHSLLAMHKGYLAIVGSRDGGAGDGNFAFYDISDIRNPQLVANYNSKETLNLREAHSYGFTVVDGKDIVVLQAKDGLQFWDWTDVRACKKVSEMILPPMRGGDYAGTPWWTSVQGKYVYVGGADTGLHIVDASDISNPKQIKILPLSRTGGFRIGPVFACGNFLVISSMDTPGISTFDISDPNNPRLLNTLREVVGYSSMFNGNRLYSVHVIPTIWDVSDPTKIKRISEYKGPNIGGKGGYGIFQDGFIHQGVSSNYAMVDVRDPKSPLLVGKIFSGVKGSDLDGGNVIGNFGIGSCDHSKGTFIAPHSVEPDTQGPEVTCIHPANGTIGLPTSTRIGLTFSDQIDLSTLNSKALVIRDAAGEVVTGRYSHQTGVVNFWPDTLLEKDTTYDVLVTKGGLRDYAGNPTDTEFVSRFSTGSALSDFPMKVAVSKPAEAGSEIEFEITEVNAEGNVTISWNFGDNTGPTPFTKERSIKHTFEKPGHFMVIAQAKAGDQMGASSVMQTIHLPSTQTKPSHSSTIFLDEIKGRAWNVNADNNTVTFSDVKSLKKISEVPVGKKPRTLAQAKNGNIWVVSQDEALVTILDGTTGMQVSTIKLRFGSRPYGLAFAPNGEAAYVATQGTGELFRIDAASQQVDSIAEIGGKLRGVAVTADGSRAYVTRFISPRDHGEIVEVDTKTMKVTQRIKLALDPGPDKEDAGRGVPNYISSLTISPDGMQAWIPSKKDNTVRGLQLDGQTPSFESTVRTIVSVIDLKAGKENLEARRDLNDRDMAFAAVFSPLGDLAFVATQGTNTIEILDAYDGRQISAILSTGLSPQGLTLSNDGTRLFVHNFMSRDIAVYDVGSVVNNFEGTATLLASIKTVDKEKLSGNVLLGKQIFYNAQDFRMNRDNYISCASCHLDGGNDGRVYDFTNRGEGMRNTTELNGRRGTGHGRVHWTANFDEIQDFEHDIRGPFGGVGFMDDKKFSNVKYPLGKPKTGQSRELDAMAAYVTSLDSVPDSPYRNQDGSLTTDAISGRKIFDTLKCFSCHGGKDFTDSASGVLHDVGTISKRSGNRLGGPLPGIDTPTLRGVWETAPYLHDGSADTLMDVIHKTNPKGIHGATQALNEPEKQQLVAYLQQIDDLEQPAREAQTTIVITSPEPTTVVSTAPRDFEVSVATKAFLGAIEKVEFYVSSADANPKYSKADEAAEAPYSFTWKNVLPQNYLLMAKAHYANGIKSTSPVVKMMMAPPPTKKDNQGKPAPARDKYELVKFGLKKDAKVYQDRNYVFTVIPEHLQAASYLMMRNNDKNTRDPKHIVLKLDKDQTVYVGIDTRGSVAWIKGWEEDIEELKTDDSSFQLFHKKFKKGETITLGNNGGGSMYLVFLTEQ